MTTLRILIELAGIAVMLATTSGVLAILVMRWTR